MTLEPDGSTSVACDCCGGTTRRVWGYLYSDAGDTAAYFVQWTTGQVDVHGAYVDLVIGRWGDGTSPADRSVATLEFRQLESGPAFMVIDASTRPSFAGIAATALNRTDVIDTPLAKRLFELVDCVWLQDERIRELTSTE